MTNEVHGVRVVGLDVDEETRCAHYHGEHDIIAIESKCCRQWFSCHACHDELMDHALRVWPKEEFTRPAVLCGACGHCLTIREYLAAGSVCPRCRRQFNPGCAAHHHLYFEISA